MKGRKRSFGHMMIAKKMIEDWLRDWGSSEGEVEGKGVWGTRDGILLGWVYLQIGEKELLKRLKAEEK